MSSSTHGDGRATFTRRTIEGNGRCSSIAPRTLHLGITSSLAKFLSEAQFSDLDETAVHAGKRGVLDWLGCAIAGSSHPTLGKLIDTLVDLGGARNATVLFRNLKLGTIEAALVNGQMGHVLDYDDTHMGGVVLHNSSPTLPAIFALAERQTVSGRDLLTAYALAFEAGVRTGQAAPDHRKCGWHLTGTLGTFAAAAATGRLLGLDAEKMTYALGIAGTQASGMQQNRGTSCKSFHAGRAASNGLLAALLAQRGFDSSGEIIEGKRGFARIYSDHRAAGVWSSTASARAGRSAATATSLMPAVFFCIPRLTRSSRSAANPTSNRARSRRSSSRRTPTPC